MLVHVKHSGWVFKQVLLQKGKGEGSTYKGRVRELCKIRMKVINSTQTQLLLRQRRIIPEIWELTTPAPNLRWL